jgi:3',5'-cyclic AMP phosphodiesterase CpdA
MSSISVTNRRKFLAAGGAALAGATLGGIPLVPGNRVEAAETTGGTRKRSLRLAHMTDMHVQPELAAGEGMTAALKHVQSIADPPELILTGGDMVMDVMGVDAARAATQWNLWQKVLKQECSLPLQHCIGNHDVWGWNRTASKTIGNEPGWGKQQAIDKFGLPGRYYGFDRGGWRFLVLDSIFADPFNVYIGRLDDEQFDWLTAELKKIPATTPVALVSHIPILSVAVVEFRQPIERNPKPSPGATHIDATRIVRLLKQHPNVKLAISGHLHMVERIEFAGVTYLCGGAVCGGWWRGPHHGTPEGYLLVDLYEDGSVENRYVAYGWKAKV